MPHLPKGDDATSELAKELEHLRQRNEFLESNMRWHRFAFDLLQGTTELIGNDDDRLSKKAILSAANEQLVRILDWEAVAFFLIDEEDQTFKIEFCSPVEHTDFLEVEVDKLIESGQFAWALNQNHEMILKSFGWDCNLILHVLATRARIRGMFVGVPALNYDELPDSSLQLISLVLNQMVYALESATLYELLSTKTDDLQLLVRQRTKQLEFQHQHDALTGRPNRQFLIQNLDEFVTRSQEKGRSLVVMRCDLAGFKRINEVYGFAGGDKLLRIFSDRMVEVAEAIALGQRFASEVLVSRIASDHFCIVFVSAKDEDRIDSVVETLVSELTQPFNIDGDQIALGIHIGASVFPTDDMKPDKVFSHAETALYAAKSRGANEYVRYDSSLGTAVVRDLKTSVMLKDSLRSEAFSIELEPMVDMFDKRVVGAQLLLQANCSDELKLTHEELLAEVDQVGIGMAFTEFALQQAAKAMQDLVKEGFSQLAVVVDITSRYFRQENVASNIINILQEHDLSAANIEVTVPESIVSEDVDRSKRVFAQLAEHGIKVWLRNVGTGTLSLHYLKNFQVSGLKLDAKLVGDVMNNADDLAIIEALTKLGHHFGASISVPGIDTEPQMEILEKTECDRAQGFFFGQPLTVDKFASFLRGRSRS